MFENDVTTRIQIYGDRGEFSLTLDPTNVNEKYYLDHFDRQMVYEPEVVAVIHRVVKPGDTCIDVGAHVGFFTLLLSKLVGDDGQVLAFEPGTNNLPKLKYNIATNAAYNVRLIEKAAWHTTDKLIFFLNADSSGGNALWDPGKYPGNDLSKEFVECYPVEAVRVGEYVGTLPKLVKIDVEGAELQVLQGMGAFSPFTIVEIGPFGLNEMGSSTALLRKFMLDMGYDTFLIHGDGALPTLVPYNTTLTHRVINEQQVTMNIMFSTRDAVGQFWREAPYESR